MLNVGLCIAMKEIVSLKDSIILPGDGASHTEVLFRYVVFRPMVGTVMTGKIRNCSREGVNVTLGFFDDILIPHAALQHPSRFDEAEQAWVWEYPLDDGGKHDLFMDVGEAIKFRVSREIFEETSPIGPPKAEGQQSQNASSSTAAAAATAAAQEVKTPYKIIVIMILTIKRVSLLNYLFIFRVLSMSLVLVCSPGGINKARRRNKTLRTAKIIRNMRMTMMARAPARNDKGLV